MKEGVYKIIYRTPHLRLGMSVVWFLLVTASCKTNEALFTNGTPALYVRLLAHSADVHADFYRVKLNIACVESVSARVNALAPSFRSITRAETLSTHAKLNEPTETVKEREIKTNLLPPLKFTEKSKL